MKRLPEIILDIDRMSLQALQPGDPNNFSNMSPNQMDSRSQKSFQPMNNNINNFSNLPMLQQEYWPHGLGQNNFNHMPHSSTPPPLLRPNSQIHRKNRFINTYMYTILLR